MGCPAARRLRNGGEYRADRRRNRSIEWRLDRHARPGATASHGKHRPLRPDCGNGAGPRSPGWQRNIRAGGAAIELLADLGASERHLRHAARASLEETVRWSAALDVRQVRTHAKTQLAHQGVNVDDAVTAAIDHLVGQRESVHRVVHDRARAAVARLDDGGIRDSNPFMIVLRCPSRLMDKTWTRIPENRERGTEDSQGDARHHRPLPSRSNGRLPRPIPGDRDLYRASSKCGLGHRTQQRNASSSSRLRAISASVCGVSTLISARVEFAEMHGGRVGAPG